uniref:RING-type E3 ubiquitin transferase n=1 Tax=Nicotiana sylvestris TaxID=4096 RepID=A0A1U7YI59_NICSY|nr:PREDICTED: RING-H2 finger protein ATL52-like [Nicotiana sylvestris]
MENIRDNNPPVSTSRSFFAPLLVSMIGIFCTALALVIYHFILTKYCLRRSTQQTIHSTVLRPNSETHNLAKGVDQKILEKIPILAYNSILKNGLFRVDQNECSICLGELEDEEMVRLLPNCRHAFHVPCIDQWFVVHASCPVCRSSVTETHVMYLLDLLLVSEINHENSSSSSSELQCHGMLRHCVSLVVPNKERRLSPSQRRLIPGLRRSLSMDYSFIVINREKLEEDLLLLRSKSMKNNYDGVSTKLLRSLSRLRMGKKGLIIPY